MNQRKSALLTPLFFVTILFLSAYPANAGISLLKDTITTSRPSASAPLYIDNAIGVSQLTIYDNGSRFIASDSAQLLGGTAETVYVASMSAAAKPGAGQRIVYLNGVTSNAHLTGTTIISGQPAKHTVTFNTTSLPASGKIQVFLPIGDTSNQASPSATGFSLNNIAATNITTTGAVSSACTATAATGLIECTLASIFAGGAVTVNIGATTPTLLNPTKTAAVGTADTWSVTVKTLDNNSVILDTSRARIATIDAVQVYAQVDPNISMTIGGITAGAAANTGNTTGCLTTEVTNTGITSTAYDVNLGVLTATQTNISAQLISITTNGAGGYSLTATSSGHLLDPGTGYWIADVQTTPTANDTPAPVAFGAFGSPKFGIHACGLDVTTATWGANNCTVTTCKYANPAAAYYYTLASDTTGPIDVSVAAGNGLTTIEYAAAISGVVPAGNYRTAMTYIATPTF